MRPDGFKSDPEYHNTVETTKHLHDWKTKTYAIPFGRLNKNGEEDEAHPHIGTLTSDGEITEDPPRGLNSGGSCGESPPPVTIMISSVTIKFIGITGLAHTVVALIF